MKSLEEVITKLFAIRDHRIYMIDAKKDLKSAKAFFRIKEQFEINQNNNVRTKMSEWCVLKVRFGSHDVERKIVIHSSRLMSIADEWYNKYIVALDRNTDTWICEMLGHCSYNAYKK